MKAQELFLENGKSANVWYCSECRIVAREKEVADNCCKKNNCLYCGKVVEEKHWSAHRDCIEKENIRKAEKIETWDGYIFYADEYYATTEDLIEALEDSGDEIPECVYVCKTIPFPAIDIDNLLERIEKNSYEDIGRYLRGVEKLSKAIEVFNEANNDLVSYLPDKNKMLRLDKTLVR